jgi:uncharacterized protein (UPF0276 family)
MTAWIYRTDRGLPRRAGLDFKPHHMARIIRSDVDIGFFEVQAEAYLERGGPSHAQLCALRERYALSLHGAELSIGAARPLDREHLRRLRTLNDLYQPEMFSEHLAWSSHDDVSFDDRPPLPYERRTLRRVCDHVDEVQQALGRRILLENPATHILFEESDMSETEFLREVARRTRCGLVLDMSNALVSAARHGQTTKRYLDEFPIESVFEIHLAGHAVDREGDRATLLIDADDRPAPDPAWDLYACVIAQAGARPTLIKWDKDLPSWETLVKEAALAEAVMRAPRCAGSLAAGGKGGPMPRIRRVDFVRWA